MKRIPAAFATALVMLFAACGGKSNNAQQSLGTANSTAPASAAADSMNTVNAVKKQVIDSINTINTVKQHVIDSMNGRRTAAAPGAAGAPAPTATTQPAANNAAPAASEAPAPASTVKKKKGWSNTAKGAVIGAGAGALTGALVSKKKGKGAIIGGLIGAGAGAGTGAIIDHKKKQNSGQ